MQARIDDNDKPTLLAVNDTTGLPERVRVDPILNMVEVFLVADDGLIPSGIVNARIDQNDKDTMLAFNETTGLTECLRTDVNGVLKVLPV